MALGSTALLPRLSSFSLPPLFSFKSFAFFSASFSPPPSPLHSSQIVLLSCSPRPFSLIAPCSSLTSASIHLHHLHESENCSSAFSVNVRTEVEESSGEEGEDKRTEPAIEQRQETEPVTASLPSFPIPMLTIKEKKELAFYAHSLGKQLKIQQIGKSGVTPTVAAAMVESLEANELLKLKVHGSCPGELSDVIMQLENATGSTAVSIIGRTLILYRPSLAKMMKKDADSSRMHQQKNAIKSVAKFKVQKKSRAI